MLPICACSQLHAKLLARREGDPCCRAPCVQAWNMLDACDANASPSPPPLQGFPVFAAPPSAYHPQPAAPAHVPQHLLPGAPTAPALEPDAGPGARHVQGATETTPTQAVSQQQAQVAKLPWASTGAGTSGGAVATPGETCIVSRHACAVAISQSHSPKQLCMNNTI